MKLKVLTTNQKTETLSVSPEEIKDLQLELSGNKNFIQEYKTIDGRILTDIDIVSIKI